MREWTVGPEESFVNMERTKATLSRNLKSDISQTRRPETIEPTHSFGERTIGCI